MTRKPIRLVFLGAGIVSGPHGKALARLDSVEFAGAFDPDQKKSEEVVSRHGGKVYHDIQAAEQSIRTGNGMVEVAYD